MRVVSPSGMPKPLNSVLELPRPVQGIAYGIVIIVVAIFAAQTQRFIYFQF